MKIVKVPFSAGSLGKNIGCEKGPDAVVDALKDVYMTESGVKPVVDVDEIPVDKTNFSLTNQHIKDKSYKAFGEHTYLSC